MSLNVAGRLAECLLFTYRTPAESIAGLVPSGMSPVSHQGWAFWSIMACRVEGARPAGWPARLGGTVRTVSYRLLVRAPVAGGQWVTGCHYVRTDVSSRVLAGTAHRATDFRMLPADVRVGRTRGEVSVEVHGTAAGDGDCWIRANPFGSFGPPRASCFSSAAQADPYTRFRPLSYSVDRQGARITLMDHDASRWDERPLTLTEGRWGFFDLLNQHQAVLERASWVAPLDCTWRMGLRAHQVFGLVRAPARAPEPRAAVEAVVRVPAAVRED